MRDTEEHDVKGIGRFLLIGLGILLLLLLVGPFLVPVPPLEGTVPARRLADPDSRFVEVDGLTVHYKLAGEGEPVFLLLHGFGASTFSWREVMTPLAELGTVVAYDRPAFGLTERPLPGEWERGENPYDAKAQVALALQLLDTLGYEEAIFVGNSAGGTVAVQTALAHPERVRALVLVDPAVYTGGPGPVVHWLLNTPQADHVGPLLVRSIQSRGESLLETAWHDPSAITPEIRAGYRQPLQAEHWDRALWELSQAREPDDLPERVDELAPPVLVITGDDDRVVPTEQSVRLAAEIPGAELEVLEACGHVPQEECPEPFMDAVRAFVVSLDAEGAGSDPYSLLTYP